MASDAQGLAQHCIDMLRAPQQASDIARRGYTRITTILTEERFQSVVDAAVTTLWRKDRNA
ncbi:hypothetical protein [Rhodoferax sp. WC2427]|uniref:hypothetical protein n=1 Tax=Rhodoferax sp. WC2427 TaxID=3234144 RepID=UPI003467DC1D